MSVAMLVIVCVVNLALLVAGVTADHWWPRVTWRCKLRGHELEVLQFFGEHARRVVCYRCGGDWVHEVRGEFAGVCLRWDADFAELYDAMGYPIRRWPRPGIESPYRSRW